MKPDNYVGKGLPEENGRFNIDVERLKKDMEEQGNKDRENLKEWVIPDNPHEPVGECGKCGLKLMRVMGYVCPNFNCPCGLGGSTC